MSKIFFMKRTFDMCCNDEVILVLQEKSLEMRFKELISAFA